MATPLPIVSEEQDGAFPDPVLRYIVAIRPMQDGLRRALIHLSGFALERITHQGHGQIGYGLVESARSIFGGIYEGLHSIAAPAAAVHHVTHLRGAAAAIEAGLRTALSSTDPEGDLLLQRLEQTNHHLRAASRCLPGTANVDLTQSCCAGAHAITSNHTAIRSTEIINGRPHGQLLDLGP
jgi:hypothetical protein